MGYDSQGVKEDRDPMREITGRALVAFTAMAFLLLTAVGPAAALTPPPLPEKAEIVFENGGRIVSVKADGSERTVLTRQDKLPVRDPWDRNHDASPSISPDGTKLLFLRTVQGKNARQMITIAGRDGSSPRTVFSQRSSPSRKTDVYLSGPVWSPPDGRILFIRSEMKDSRKNGRPFSSFRDDVIAITPAGAGPEVVFTRRMDSSFGKQPPGGGDIEEIDLSVDGTKLLVSGRGAREQERIDVINLAGGGSRLIRKGGHEARWSPDGSRILFTSDHQKIGKTCDWMDVCSYDEKLYVMNADSSGLRRVEPGRKRGFQNGGRWSPDGSHILFWSDRNAPGNAEIYTIRTDGKCLTWLTNGSIGSTDADWAPELGRDPAPGFCGAGDHPPLVEVTPRAKVRVKGRPAGWTRLWLGPDFETTFYESDGGLGRGLDMSDYWGWGTGYRGISYGGCSKFNPADCADVDYNLGYQDVCKAWGSNMLDHGKYGRLTKRRGALVMEPKPVRRHRQDPLVLTGRQAVSVKVLALRKVTRAWQFRVINGLRPVGATDASAPLAAPVLDRRMVRKAARINRKLRRTSVRKLSRKTGRSRKAVHSWARFHRDLNRVGPVRTTPCRGWK